MKWLIKKKNQTVSSDDDLNKIDLSTIKLSTVELNTVELSTVDTTEEQ